MEKNLSMEPSVSHFRCGMVSIIGRPNVGKSTLLNCIVNQKVAIVSPVPQTTRHRIRGIYTEARGQIIFVDTPGFHLGGDHLDQLMNQSCVESMTDADCVIHLVDANERVGQEEQTIVSKLKNIKVPIVLGLNKVDAKGERISEYIALWQSVKGEALHTADDFVILPLSGKTGLNRSKVIDLLFGFLPVGPPLYPEETKADTPQQMAIADILREKLFAIMKQEIPHSLAVVVEQMEKRAEDLHYIRAVVMVERDSQKEIVIGRRGQILKDVGTLAREELERLLQTRVFLEIFVKAKKNWREDFSLLQDLGYGS